jgi:hypothetical protein
LASSARAERMRAARAFPSMMVADMVILSS